MIKSVLAAVGLTVVMSTAALAAPTPTPVSGLGGAFTGESLNLTKIADRNDRRSKSHRSRRHRTNRRHRYVPGSRRHTAPRGWHRHRHRPRDWRTRGCIVVGPVWFCP